MLSSPQEPKKGRTCCLSESGSAAVSKVRDPSLPPLLCCWFEAWKHKLCKTGRRFCFSPQGFLALSSRGRWGLTTKYYGYSVNIHEQLQYLCLPCVHFLWRILCTVLNWYSTALTSPLSAAVDSLSSAPRAQSTTPLQRVSTTEGHTREPLITFSSQTTHPVQDTGSTAPSTAQPQSESMTTASTQTTGHPLASAAGWGPAGPTHREVPSELNVGDEGKLRENGFSHCELYSLTSS